MSDLATDQPPALASAAEEARADPAPHAASGICLELDLHPDDAARLLRLPALTALRAGPSRPVPLLIVWHDSADSALARAGLSLAERRLGGQRHWRLEQARPDAEAWRPGSAPELLAQAATIPDLAAGLSQGLPPDLVASLAPVAAFRGQQRSLRLSDEAAISAVHVRTGMLRAVADEVPVARLLLEGQAAAVFGLARQLAEHLRVSVPAESLAAQAQAVARPLPAPVPPEAPRLAPDMPAGEAFACVAGQLSATILHFAPQARMGIAPVPVHQMRVALRRLRSAISLFQRAVGCPELDLARADLRLLAQALGPARDWDVFTSGTGHAVGAAFPDDRAVQRLLTAAGRRRAESYTILATMLDGPAYRGLMLTLAQIVMTHPWDAATTAAAGPEGDGAMEHVGAASTDLRSYAVRALSRRMRHVTAAGENIGALPVEALHALRIQCKRLRYACEFFAPLFGGRDSRRAIRRLSMVQERLGHLNDGSVAGALMGELGAGAAGERSFATGIVLGFVAAQTQGVRRKAEASWRKFQHEKPFWH